MVVNGAQRNPSKPSKFSLPENTVELLDVPSALLRTQQTEIVSRFLLHLIGGRQKKHLKFEFCAQDNSVELR
jgi:hypothetical protein